MENKVPPRSFKIGHAQLSFKPTDGEAESEPWRAAQVAACVVPEDAGWAPKTVEESPGELRAP